MLTVLENSLPVSNESLTASVLMKHFIDAPEISSFLIKIECKNLTQVTLETDSLIIRRNHLNKLCCFQI